MVWDLSVRPELLQGFYSERSDSSFESLKLKDIEVVEIRPYTSSFLYSFHIFNFTFEVLWFFLIFLIRISACAHAQSFSFLVYPDWTF